jgi:hypothetical protein
MPTDPSSLAERVATSIQELSIVAKDLNSASDELGKAISAIDAVLQSLGLGIETWTRIVHSDSGDGQYYSYRDLGYAKVGNKWGVTLRSVRGDVQDPDGESSDYWLFNEAPRWMRLEGVDKLPALIDSLVKSAAEATTKIQSKAVEANQIARAIAQAAGRKPADAVVASPIASLKPHVFIAPPDSSGVPGIAPPTLDKPAPIFSSPSYSYPNPGKSKGAKPKGGK